MNIFWIGLIIIIMFLFYEYRKLEQRYTKVIKNNGVQIVDSDKVLKKIFNIETQLKEIRNELDKGSKDA